MAARIMVVADLHLDQWKHAGLDPLQALGPAEWQGLEALIVAGDLSNEAARKWPRYLARLAALMDPARIHILPGNHDYYGMRLGQDADLAELCRAHGIGFLQKSELQIAEELYLCCTLWTDHALAGNVDQMSDFRRIAGPDGGTLRPAQVAALHRDHLGWLQDRLQACQGRATVITHHLPHPDLLMGTQAAPGGFASDLGWLLAQARPKAWLFGHAHDAACAAIAGVPCRNVALGPPRFAGLDAGPRLGQLITPVRA